MALKLDCYCASLRQATRIISQLYDEALRTAGLTTTQFTLLKVLSALGGARVGDLADALGMEQSTMTRTLALMYQAGLIEKDPGASRRESRYLLTATGAEKLKKALPLWDAAQKRVNGKFGRKEAESLRDLAFSLSQKLTA